MTQTELPDYTVLAEESRKRHRHNMFRNLIAAAIFGVMAIGLVYALASQSVSNSAFVLLIFGSVLSGLYTIGAIFEAGCEYQQKCSEPHRLEEKGKYQKLWKEFDEYRVQSQKTTWSWAEEYQDLLLFVRNKSPELMAEIKKWKKKQSQPPAEENKE